MESPVHKAGQTPTPTSHPEGLCINTTVYSWIVEANVLPALGMPKGAFTLLFDATPYLDHGVALFRAVKWVACDQRLKELEIAEMCQVDAPT
jgi:hypothetical protein